VAADVAGGILGRVRINDAQPRAGDVPREHIGHDPGKVRRIDVLRDGREDHPGSQVAVPKRVIPCPRVDPDVAGDSEDVSKGVGVGVEAQVGEPAAMAEQLPEGDGVPPVLAEGR